MEKFKSLEKDIAIHGRELKEVKTHNKWQDEEYRNMNRYMQNISEAIVEMKVMNKNMHQLLLHNSNKVDDIDKKIDNKIEATENKIESIKEIISSESLKHHFDLRLMFKQWIPPLILFGLLYLIINIIEGGI